jgi:type I restriction-modification system DNA methylase subunit
MSIIELERTLWAIADKLRANMDTNEEVFMCF